MTKAQQVGTSRKSGNKSSAAVTPQPKRPSGSRAPLRELLGDTEQGPVDVAQLIEKAKQVSAPAGPKVPPAAPVRDLWAQGQAAHDASRAAFAHERQRGLAPQAAPSRLDSRASTTRGDERPTLPRGAQPWKSPSQGNPYAGRNQRPLGSMTFTCEGLVEDGGVAAQGKPKIRVAADGWFTIFSDQPLPDWLGVGTWIRATGVIAASREGAMYLWVREIVEIDPLS